MPAYKPEECDQLLFETIDNGDLDGALDLYEPDAVFVVSPGHVVTGHAAIREVLKGMLAAGGTGKLERLTAVCSTDGCVVGRVCGARSAGLLGFPIASCFGCGLASLTGEIQYCWRR